MSRFARLAVVAALAAPVFVTPAFATTAQVIPPCYVRDHVNPIIAPVAQIVTCV